MDNKTVHPLILLLTPAESADLETFKQATFQIQSLKAWFRSEIERTGKEELALKRLFKKIQKEVFQEYEIYAPFYEVIKKGKYNCVTGTAYFSYLLNELGYQTEIWETPFHVYLTTRNSKGERILIESTDPDFGFVRSRARIEELEALYSRFDGNWGLEHAQVGEIQTEVEKENGEYRKKISLVELNGLQYLNMGVTALENGQTKRAYSYLSKADFFYPSPRTKTLLSLFEGH